MAEMGPFRQRSLRAAVHSHRPRPRIRERSFAALRGQEEIYSYLLERFPNLVIEHVYGADGLARFARNFPVSYDESDREQTYKIRHAVVGASYWFPGGCGQSFLWDRPDPIANRPDLKPLGFLMQSHSKYIWTTSSAVA